MLHSNYPKLITSEASVMDKFMVQVDIYTSVSRVLVILVTLASNIHIKFKRSQESVCNWLPINTQTEDE